MSYIINNSRGQTIAVVPDGTINTTSTSLNLVGRAVSSYGTAENENYVFLLENFANDTGPLQPILGQLWYNSSTDVISAYSSGNTWIALASQDYVQAQKISPTFTGVPTAPTAAAGTANTQLATTGFVYSVTGNLGTASQQNANAVNITGGTITGIAKFLKEQNPNIQVWAIDPVGSLLTHYFKTGEIDHTKVAPYIAEGFGEDFVPENYDMSVINHFEQVNDKDGALMTRRIAKEEGLFCGYSAGSCLQGLLQLKDKLKPTDVAVCIFHDHGSRYVGKVYNDDWMKSKGFL